jgi:hypothetical protein
MLLSPTDIANSVARGLRSRARADEAEQVVYGFDAHDELELHPVIRKALAEDGFGAWAEQTYPSEEGGPRRSEGRRCDLVVTPDGHPVRDTQLKGTLFDTADAVDPDQAFWLEIKTVAQFEPGGPFRRYSAEMFTAVVQDVKKLWDDALIRHAGLLLVLFTASRDVADHDLATWHRRCLQRGFPVGAPSVRGFEIINRIGNGWCAAAVFSVRG